MMKSKNVFALDRLSVMNLKSTPPAQSPAGPLRWISGSKKLFLAELIYAGYKAIDRAAKVRTGYDPQPFHTYSQHLPVPVLEWFPYLPDDGTPNDFQNRATEFFHVAAKETLPSETMSKREIIAWLTSEMRRLYLKPSLTKHVFEDPVQLIQLGFRLVRVAGRWYMQESTPFVASLCLVGLGAHGITTQKKCVECFRLTLPGFKRCRLHSLSKLLKADTTNAHANTVRQTRAAKLTAAELNWPQDLEPILRVSHAQFSIYGILWGLKEADHQEWLRQIKQALALAPTVRQLLPLDFFELRSGEQLALLRANLDENEWIFILWPVKIAAAEQWIVAQQRVAPPRVLGLSEKNKKRVQQATSWLSEDLPNKTIAQRLGISASYLSHLLARSSKHS